MVSNQLLQNTLEGLKQISRLEFTLFGSNGQCVVTTQGETIDLEQSVGQFIHSKADSQEVQGHYLFKIHDAMSIEYILAVSGKNDQIYTIGEMAAFQMRTLVVAYKEKFDKENFVKDLLLDNLLKIDIYNRADKLGIPARARRVTFIAEVQGQQDSQLLQALKELGDLAGDFITSVEESSLVIVKNLKEAEKEGNLDKTAKMIEAALKEAGAKNVRMAYGTIGNELKEVSGSYKEAKMALDVGRIFLPDRKIIAYSELGIGRLIYQLPIPLCKMFIKEIFGGKSLDDLDGETQKTITKFFENSLNVSETSRQLFIHRNTLVYRLDKLEKMTSLDIRVFDDAITFKIAMMVVKYMKYMETYQY